jgi:GDP-L-fucose synthase
MKILVTGATGFLGTTLCRHLADRAEVIVRLGSKDADLTRPGSLDRFNATAFDQIYHLAAWTQAGDFCLRHPGQQWIINQQMNTHLLAWWQQRQPQAKLITIGTSCSYAPDLPLVEANYLLGTPIESLYTYAMTKRMLYIGQLALQKQFGLRWLTVVPSTLYGPGYHMDGRQMHFIFDLIRKILRAKLYDEPVMLWGDGHQKRELIHVEDFSRLLVDLAQGRENELVNIGAGAEHTIRHFAEMICRIAGYDVSRIGFDTTRYVGARSKCLDISRLRALVPSLHLIPLEQGLEQTVRWFEQNREALLPPPSRVAA